jgi:hypothetical protein
MRWEMLHHTLTESMNDPKVSAFSSVVELQRNVVMNVYMYSSVTLC